MYFFVEHLVLRKCQNVTQCGLKHLHFPRPSSSGFFSLPKYSQFFPVAACFLLKAMTSTLPKDRKVPHQRHETLLCGLRMTVKELNLRGTVCKDKLETEFTNVVAPRYPIIL